MLADDGDAAARRPIGGKLVHQRLSDVGALDPAPRQDDGTWSLPPQGTDDVELAFGRSIGYGHGHDEVVFLRALDGTSRDGREIRVVDASHHEGRGGRRAPGEGLGRQVRLVVELGGGGEHLGHVLLAYVAGAAVKRA